MTARSAWDRWYWLWDVYFAITFAATMVLRLVAKGCTNADIGRALHITEATVKTHLLRMFNKLGVSDRTAAVTTAMSRHFLE